MKGDYDIDVGAVLEAAAAAAVPAVADYCVAFFVGREYAVRRLASCGDVRDDERAAIARFEASLGWHSAVVPPLAGQALIGRLDEGGAAGPLKGFASILAAPLLVEDQVVGGIVFAARDAVKHTGRAVDGAHAVAFATSRILESARRYDEARQQLAERAPQLADSLLQASRRLLSEGAGGASRPARVAECRGHGLVAAAAAACAADAQARQVELLTDVEAGVRLRCDRDAIIDALVELVTLAIARSPAGGRVRVGVYRGFGEVVFFVEDDGLLDGDRGQPGHAGAVADAHGGELWIEATRGLRTAVRLSVPTSGRALATTGEAW